jgi:NAD(P)-dependent dehydrogenase (short-subunit alcohol dehydrogenase family)
MSALSKKGTTMKVMIIGATGTIGKAVAAALRENHQIVAVSRSTGDHRADITDKTSLEKTFAAIGKVDAIVSAAGGAVFKPLAALSDADFEKCLHDKLMGQVNVVRVGSQYVRPGGSITITSGVLAQDARRRRDQPGQCRAGRFWPRCRARVEERQYPGECRQPALGGGDARRPEDGSGERSGCNRGR